MQNSIDLKETLEAMREFMSTKGLTDKVAAAFGQFCHSVKALKLAFYLSTKTELKSYNDFRANINKIGFDLFDGHKQGFAASTRGELEAYCAEMQAHLRKVYELPHAQTHVLQVGLEAEEMFNMMQIDTDYGDAAESDVVEGVMSKARQLHDDANTYFTVKDSSGVMLWVHANNMENMNTFMLLSDSVAIELHDIPDNAVRFMLLKGYNSIKNCTINETFNEAIFIENGEKAKACDIEYSEITQAIPAS